jgi:hypothetical protein
MKQVYCGGNPALIWEPVLGVWVDNDLAIAAHLFPWRSADMMNAIFGPGSRDELFSAANGLFLHPKIEQAFNSVMLMLLIKRWLTGRRRRPANQRLD